jgi:hypothetical protein
MVVVVVVVVVVVANYYDGHYEIGEDRSDLQAVHTWVVPHLWISMNRLRHWRDVRCGDSGETWETTLLKFTALSAY